MVGLRSPLVAVALAILYVGYAATMIGTSGPADGEVWAVQIGAMALQLACVLTAIWAPTDPLPAWAAGMIAVVSVAALGASWWSPAPDSLWWVQVTAPPALTSVTAGVLALRGRIVYAWLAWAGSIAVAIAWTMTHHESLGTAVVMTNRVITAVLPATIVALLVRPMIRLMGALQDREVAAVRYQAAASATAVERTERLSAFASTMEPILQRVADGDEFSADEAASVRLLEHSLRDEVRGRIWNSEGVRVAAAQARRRGVRVQLFDDGGLDLDALTAHDAERLRGELIRTLTGVRDGVVTARVLPPEREQVAVLNVADDEGVRRRTCRATPTGLRWTPDTGRTPEPAP